MKAFLSRPHGLGSHAHPTYCARHGKAPFVAGRSVLQKQRARNDPAYLRWNMCMHGGEQGSDVLAGRFDSVTIAWCAWVVQAVGVMLVLSVVGELDAQVSRNVLAKRCAHFFSAGAACLAHCVQTKFALE